MTHSPGRIRRPFPFRLWPACTAALLLAACGGGNSGATSPQAGDTGAAVAPVGTAADPFAVPASLAYADVPVQGFYDVDASGAVRTVRNDLSGTLSGMVQFGQSLTVDPRGNTARHMPTLTAEREALVMFTPDAAAGPAASVRLRATLNGVLLGELPLAEPAGLPRSDFAGIDARPDLDYSRRAWSAVLPWDWMKPGLALRLSDGAGRTGDLAAADIAFAAPAELVVHSIRVGMLTDPPAETDDHWFLRQPEKAAADYFQTVPVAQLTAARYDPVRLSRVMVATGVVYTTASADDGGTYDGDMRGDTAKATISVGINLADVGASSSSMDSQEQPGLFQNVVVHHAAGNYRNGVQVHGLSGGNGMLTLFASRYNELSHEIGHHFGLGHFPGEDNGNYFWSSHHYDSGWGYLGHRRRMRANLRWAYDKSYAMAGSPVWQGSYAFMGDAMSGGGADSEASVYTLYTGYSTQTQIQPELDKPMPRTGVASGWVRWNAASGTLQEVRPALPASTEVAYGGSGGVFPAPRRVGVPVFTLVGGYDPAARSAVLYPALRGNWGNVFDLAPPPASTAADACWLEIGLAGGARRQVALAPSRLKAGAVNKFHVNVAQDEQPVSAAVYCRAAGSGTAQQLDGTLAIATGLPAMPAPVVIGRAAGYAALRAVEMPQLQAELLAQASHATVALGHEARQIFLGNVGHEDELSAAARLQWARYASQEDRAGQLSRWLGAFGGRLAAGDAGARDALGSLLARLSWPSAPLAARPAPLTVAGNCLKADLDAAPPRVYLAAPGQCSGPSAGWVMDLEGRIHSGQDLSRCLAGAVIPDAPLGLVACNRNADTQIFQAASTAGPLGRGSHCVDWYGSALDGSGQGTPGTYTCTGGSNQNWSAPARSDDPLLMLLGARDIALLQALPH